MKEQCKQAVAKALGKTSLSAQEVQNIEARINQAMVNLARKDIDHWRGLSDIEKLSAASKQVAEDIQADLARKKRIAVQDILIQNKNLATLQDPALKISASERIDRMVASYGDMSGIQSVDSKARAIADVYRGQMVDTYLNIKGGLGIYTDKTMVENIIRELHGESTGNATALKAAQGISKTFDDILERFNRAGGDIKKRRDYALPQHHSPEKVASAGKERWINETIDLIKREDFVDADGNLMSDDELRSLLGDMYTTIVTDGANKIEVGTGYVGGGAKVTSKHQEGRVLNFKDADAWMDYQSQ